jgi:D-alanyl-D-alanine carboxypeptidase (penicillin-binding protein 5/6)
MKKLTLIILFAFVIFSFCTTAEELDMPELDADYALVYNLETQKALYEKNADSIIYPASLAKIMTGLLACEYYTAVGNPNLTVTVTDTALANVEGNKMGLLVGETVLFYDLIAAVMVGSANDAAYVVAETVGGTVDNFVDMMNERAKELGATHTNYANPSGYHSSYMLTTLRDQSLICAAAAKKELLLELSSLVEYEMPKTDVSKKRIFTNQNLLFDSNHWLRHYTPGTKGLNVGMTTQAGWCLATVYDDDGLTNIVLVSGGSVDGFDYLYLKDAKNIIKYTSEAYAFAKVLDKGEMLHDVEVKLGEDKDRLILTTESEITSLLPISIDVEKDIRIESELSNTVFEAPIKEGDKFGVVKAYYGDELLGEVNLVALTSVKRSFKLLIFDRIGKVFSNKYVKAILWFLSSLMFAAIVAFFIYACIKRRRYKIAQRRARAQNVTHARKTVRKE